jgi:hypothetical protein
VTGTPPSFPMDGLPPDLRRLAEPAVAQAHERWRVEGALATAFMVIAERMIEVEVDGENIPADGEAEDTFGLVMAMLDSHDRALVDRFVNGTVALLQARMAGRQIVVVVGEP